MGQDLGLWQGAEGEERFPHLGKTSPLGISAGTEGEIWGLRGEPSNQSVAGRTE